jgi:hypothetical protein
VLPISPPPRSSPFLSTFQKTFLIFNKFKLLVSLQIFSLYKTLLALLFLIKGRFLFIGLFTRLLLCYQIVFPPPFPTLFLKDFLVSISLDYWSVYKCSLFKILFLLYFFSLKVASFLLVFLKDYSCVTDQPPAPPLFSHPLFKELFLFQ